MHRRYIFIFAIKYLKPLLQLNYLLFFIINLYIITIKVFFLIKRFNTEIYKSEKTILFLSRNKEIIFMILYFFIPFFFHGEKLIKRFNFSLL
jgi:hypothetical protein